jgi:hypothetical protein
LHYFDINRIAVVLERRYKHMIVPTCSMLLYSIKIKIN